MMMMNKFFHFALCASLAVPSIWAMPPPPALGGPWTAAEGNYRMQSYNMIACIDIAFDLNLSDSSAGRASGSLGCEQYEAKVTPSPLGFEGNISFSEIVSSLTFCEDDDSVSAVGRAFLASLKDFTSYTFYGADILWLSGPNSLWRMSTFVDCPPETNQVCATSQRCCVDDCCGVGTKWDASQQRCVKDLSSEGFTGTHAPGYSADCRPVSGWACCEGTCCGESTHYDDVTAYCLPTV